MLCLHVSDVMIDAGESHPLPPPPESAFLRWKHSIPSIS